MHPLDLAIVVGWLVLTLAAGVGFRRLSTPTMEGFFVANRSLPWWVVGTSMVATTFAADTPLVVSGFVATAGVAGNWTWWWMGAAGIVSVFLFANLWRRADVLTDAELTELRYTGRAAAGLRGLKALWFGIFMNVLTIAWVMGAMRKMLATFLELPDAGPLGISPDQFIVLGLFVLAVIYTSAAGLIGVVATDVMQFILAMGGAILLAVLSWRRVGGLNGMRQSFLEQGLDWEATTRLIPEPSLAPDSEFSQFAVIVCVIWWASKQVDGGGYLAQRVFATKDERHAVWAYLWFAVAHVCVRPWPWVIVGLAGMAMLGPLEDPELYYPRMMVEVLPPGAFGLMFASFLAAFMSTIDTQLNWGASLLVNDLYRRFARPHASDAELMAASRGAVLALAAAGAVASVYVESLGGAWELAFSVTAGLGLVYIARWYWWRTNAWSEIAAMGVAGVLTFAATAAAAAHPEHGGSSEWLSFIPGAWFGFPYIAAAITFIGAPIWIGVTLITAPVPRAHLLAFYRRVRPGGVGWRAVAGADAVTHGPDLWTLSGIVGGLAFMYGTLLGIGGAILGQPLAAAAGSMFGINGAWALYQATARHTAQSQRVTIDDLPS